MSELPLSIGTMHFTGIGGIGMSGIAEILYDVSGLFCFRANSNY